MVNIPKFFTDDESAPSKLLLPLLPLRDIVVFPYMVAPLFVGREKSVNALFAGHNPHSTASRHLLKKLGFRYTHDEY